MANKPIDCQQRDAHFQQLIQELPQAVTAAAVAGAQVGGIQGADHNVSAVIGKVTHQFPLAAPEILPREKLSALKEAIHGEINSHAPRDPALATALSRDIGQILHVDPSELGHATATVDSNCQKANAPRLAPGR